MAVEVTGKGRGAPDFVKEFRQSIYIIDTDPGLHFTGALAQGVSEGEDITGLRTDRIRINEITIQSDQQLKYLLMIYRKDTKEESDLDDDSFLSAIEFDLETYGIQQDTSQWKMSISDVDLDYMDDDETKELHLVLVNLSTTTKNAGADGNVKFSFLCETRA